MEPPRLPQGLEAPRHREYGRDADAAAEAYRQRVLAQLEATATSDERATVREQLSGACTTEIASFDEFSSLLAQNVPYAHIVRVLRTHYGLTEDQAKYRIRKVDESRRADAA